MQAPTPFRHLPHLDALRGLAILGVLVNHMIPVPGAMYCGWAGVELFFVLSGFLITRILLAERAKAEQAGTKGAALVSFYCRRALRIFPIYYLTILILYAIKTPMMQKHLWFHLTYTYDFRLVLHPGEDSFVAHFWSLCVEEQFYLVWPFLMLFLPRRILSAAVVSVVLIGPVSRVWFALQGHPRLWLYMLPCCSLDCLGMGGLLAHVEARVGTARMFRSWFVRGCQWLGVGLIAGFLYLVIRAETYTVPRWFGQMDFVWIVGNSCLAVFFTYLVARSCAPPAGDWQRLMEMRWLRYTGKISYGLYIYHLVLANQLHRFVKPTAYPMVWPDVWVSLPLSFLVATLSWYTLERPILRLKDFFTQERIRGWPRLPEVAEPVTERRIAA